MRGFLILVLAMLWCLETPAADNLGPNRNIVREVVGTLRLQTKVTKRYRGVEHWRIFVHPDGSRTMIMNKDFAAANALQIMTAHVDAAFRPIDVQASYWTRDGYRGSIQVALDGTRLRAVSANSSERHMEDIQVPHEISVVTHGESMNGWYLWQGQRDRDGHHAATYFNLSPAPGDGMTIRGRLHPASFQYLGEETVTVPAGTFATQRYLLTNIAMWISGEDRILVKQEITDENKEYVLTELSTRDAVPSSPTEATN